MYLDKYLTRTA